jgi:hypothetical protein
MSSAEYRVLEDWRTLPPGQLERRLHRYASTGATASPVCGARIPRMRTLSTGQPVTGQLCPDCQARP